MKNLKNQKGITLVALVVTIIVLLILAGVSLSLVAGSNGIMTRAVNATNANESGTGAEQAELRIAELQAEYYEKYYVTRDDTVMDLSQTAYIEQQCTTPKALANKRYSIQIDTTAEKVIVRVGETGDNIVAERAYKPSTVSGANTFTWKTAAEDTAGKGEWVYKTITQ